MRGSNSEWFVGNWEVAVSWITPTCGRLTARNSPIVGCGNFPGLKIEPGASLCGNQRSERYTGRNQAVLVRLAFEGFTEVRMGDGDQRHGALRHSLSFEVDHAIFGHNIHHVGAWRRDNVAGRQVEHDPAARLAPFVKSGRHTNKRLASF